VGGDGAVIAGLLLGLGASVCWAAANVAIQRSARTLGVVPALLWAQVVGGAVLAVAAALLERPTAPWTPALLAWTAAGGLAACLAYVGLFYATAYGRLSLVVPIVSSWALIALAVGVGVLGEAVGLPDLAGVLLVVAGVTLVARAAGRGDAPTEAAAERRALAAAVGGALGFGVLVPAIDQLTPAAGPLGAVAVVFAVELLIALPVARGLGVRLEPPARAGWTPVAIAGLFEVAGFACVSLGAMRAPLAMVAPAASVSAPLTVLWAWLVLRERPGALAAGGAALSACGVLLLAG
jgi:drug/metabolite transporter (DMT)-like permease